MGEELRTLADMQAEPGHGIGSQSAEVQLGNEGYPEPIQLDVEGGAKTPEQKRIADLEAEIQRLTDTLSSFPLAIATMMGKLETAIKNQAEGITPDLYDDIARFDKIWKGKISGKTSEE